MNKMAKPREVVSLATGLSRPSREEAEAAVRTLIRWAGDDPAREGLVALQIQDLPRSGPFALAAGRDALRVAEAATERALDGTLQPVITVAA